MGAAVDGDAASYCELLESLAAVLRETVRRGCERARIGNSEVEDIVQEILLAIHLKRHTWRREDPIGAWIFAICRNKLVDALRRRGRRAEVAIDGLLDILPAAEAADSNMAGHDVARMLDHLGPRQREIVDSISIEGHSVRETAERLKMSEGAVRVSLHRALKALSAIYRSTAP
jgi:RNA polymerase sigma-70 factor (ECF subfamily)